MAIKIIVPMLALLALTAPASAAQFDSAYTDINLDDCTVMNSDDFGSTWACPGYKGYPLWIGEGDLRFFISYGFDSGNEIVAGQTPPPFNYLGPKLEWRLSNASGGFKPIATIVRYFVQLGDTDKQGQVLVVTQIEPGNTCHIGYIDAVANSNANQLARDIADKAGNFDCASASPTFSAKFQAWDN